VDPDWKHHLDYDLLFSLEREIFADFGVAVDFTYRWDSRRSWNNYYYPEEFFPGLDNHVRSKDDYQKATQVYEDFPALTPVPGGGLVPDFIIPDTDAEKERWGDTISTEEAAGKDWYVLKDIPEAAYTQYSYTSNRPDRHNKYYGVDLRWYKRFSNKWMFSGSFTYQMQKQYYGEGYNNPTSLWAFDEQQYTNSMGGSSGKISVPMFTRWMFKLQGMYALPYGFNVSFTLNAREGMLIDRWFEIYDYNQPNTRSQGASIEMQQNNNEGRLPNMIVVNFKLEKMMSLGDVGKVWLSIDAFNAFNNQTMNRQRTSDFGNYYVSRTTNLYAPYSRNAEPNEALNPIVLRLGLRFQF
jgi:hypothetical protein